MPSKRLETATKYINHFATLDSSLLETLLAENHIHEFAPKSMNPPGPFDKPGFLAYSGSLHEIMTGFPVYAKEYIESENENQVTVWTTSKTEFREDVKDDGILAEEWVYEGEYVFMFWMDESGQKIIRTVEFLDSEGTNKVLRPLMKRAKENRAKRLGLAEK
jgi:hypothetical protein